MVKSQSLRQGWNHSYILKAQTTVRFLKGSLKASSLCLIILITLGLISRYSSYAYEGEKTFSSISEADEKLKQAFAAVLKAEKGGATISDELTNKLNAAQELLTRANTSFLVGEYGNASLLAGQSMNLADAIVQDAGYLENQAGSERNTRFTWAFLLSTVGLVMLFVVSLFGWKLVKKRYLRQFLEMKPEETTRA